MEQFGKINPETPSATSKALKNSANPSQGSMRQRLTLLQAALTKMSLIRGETMGEVRLTVYSEALAEEFSDDRDTWVAMNKLIKTRRGEFEAKIPELGDLLELVREERRTRLRTVRENQEREEHEAYLREQKEHPEQFFSLADAISTLTIERKGTATPPVASPGRVASPTISETLPGASVSEYTPGELRALADAMDHRDRIRSEMVYIPMGTSPEPEPEPEETV